MKTDILMSKNFKITKKVKVKAIDENDDKYIFGFNERSL